MTGYAAASCVPPTSRAALALAPIVGAALLSLAAAACAPQRTQVAEIPRAALRDEQVERQRYLLETRLKQQARLQAVGYPLLRSSLPLCGQDVTRRMGVIVANAPAFGKGWAGAARAAGFGDEVSVTQVLPGSGAERAGLRAGDRLAFVSHEPVLRGPAAARELGEWLAKHERAGTAEYRVTYRRDTLTATATVPADSACDYRLVVVQSDSLNAYADGENVYVTSGMLRFAADDAELAALVAHQVAHNALHHIGAPKDRAQLDARSDATAALAAAGSVDADARGDALANRLDVLGAMVFPPDLEWEADYVAMYAVARAGRAVDDAAELWRHVAVEGARAARFASSHPTTAERFLWLRHFASEIREKESAGVPLVADFVNAAASMRTPGIASGEVQGRAYGARSSAAASRSTTAAKSTLAAATAASPTSGPHVVAAAASATDGVDGADGVAKGAPPPVDGVESDGTVRVQVYVHVPGWIVGGVMTPANYPVLVVGPANDSTVVRTDEFGSATLKLRPGRYRVATLAGDVVAARQRYEWSFDVDVAPGMWPIELTERNGRRRGRR